MTIEAEAPTIDAQRGFWNAWNSTYRGASKDAFQSRQAAIATSLARSLAHALRVRTSSPLRLLDAGCGTGWLAAELSAFGQAHGFDLSSAAIEHGRRAFPNVTLWEGTFETLREQLGVFDLVVSSDVLAHVPDQAGYVRDVAAALRPGGTFLLMSQNPFVWHRSSYLSPRGDGQIRDWPSLARIRELLAERFTIANVSTIEPGGDRGVLRLTGNRVARRIGRLPGIGRVWTGALERMGVGRELVVVAMKA